MVIDLHAHFVPRAFLETLEKDGAPYGASVRREKDPTMIVGGRPYGPITRPPLAPPAPPASPERGAGPPGALGWGGKSTRPCAGGAPRPPPPPATTTRRSRASPRWTRRGSTCRCSRSAPRWCTGPTL